MRSLVLMLGTAMPTRILSLMSLKIDACSDDLKIEACSIVFDDMNDER